MKITPAQQQRFISAPGAAKAFLIYGPDEGQSRSIAKQLTQHFLGKIFDSINLTELEADTLSDDPALLMDALNSYSLLGGNRVIVVRHANAAIADIIESALDVDSPPIWPLIITAGDLKPASKLRKFFESSKSYAAIACYKDDAKKVTQILAESFKERNIICESGVIAYLAESLGNDRAITLQEIEKIDLYLGEDRKLTMQIAELIAGDNGDHTMEDLFHAVCTGSNNLEDTLSRCFIENIQPIAIYRRFSPHLQKLLSIKLMAAQGMALKAVFMRHGVFFKQEPLISKQITCWNDASLKRAIQAILEAEESAKFEAIDSELYCRNLLFKLASYASSTRRLRA